MDSLKKQYEEIIKKVTEEKFAELKKELETLVKRETAKSQAGVLLVQSGLLYTLKRYREALESGLSSVIHALKSGDQANIQRALHDVTNDYLPRICSEELDEHPHIRKMVESILESLRASDGEDRQYTNYIISLESAYRAVRPAEAKVDEKKE